LSELTLTTNGTQLKRYADAIAAAGVKRINVSLDTLDPIRFERLTGRPLLETVLTGIDAAAANGISVKINTVAIKDSDEKEIPSLIAWAHERGFDISLIEIMPMGESAADRVDQYLPLSAVRERLEARWTLTPLALRTGGPARYVRVEETGGRLGFITPLTNNFCDGCNRVRLTCTGRLYMCLGQEDSADFRDLLRSACADAEIDAAIDEAISRKPKGHEFQIAQGCARSASSRKMSVTGG
jgi:cyclic pyranopterin phosphate synthase